MLQGAGGNVGVSLGADGLLIVDDQYAQMAEKIAAALQSLSDDEPVKYIINTHYHSDHTGSNDYFVAQQRATVLAQQNVRVRLLADPDTPPGKLPVITYKDGIELHFNDDTLAVHAFTGHTDGDSIIYFEDANVMHAGDLFFNGMFPYIDMNGGGNVEHYLESIDQILALCNEDTLIIPGHGPLATPADYRSLRDMIRATYRYVVTHIEAGLTVEEIVAQGVAPQYKTFAWEFISEERWLRILHANAIENGVF
jgi:glyoxylase-like metal-dependent hydrolase (beta-lactamase superfamily II)